MSLESIVEGLNDAQKEAVTAPTGPLLVLAGAGSGKTRVLTHRVVWMVNAMDYSPMSLLAVTFTNKAAREMKSRIEVLLEQPIGGMWIGTFHSICFRLLRRHHVEAGLPEHFQIIDADDQQRLVKRVIREMGLDEAYWPAKQMTWFINGHKEDGRRPSDLTPRGNGTEDRAIEIYERYETQCRQSGVVDFAELLLRTVELLENTHSIREHYQRRFRYLLVDEFQDTNAIQYRFLKLLLNEEQSLLAVGDDDQSIYGWRGAKVENILRFDQDFHGAHVVRLEQNYRSTNNILSAANAVVANNRGRHPKTLWTAEADGEPIRFYAGYNDYDEARFVVGRIGEWLERGNARSSIAILYRSNAQSRVFEEVLVDAAIPYRVYGGMRFFERAEIKDAVAYLRLVASRDTDPAFERAVNTPPRGIGARTVEKLREHARDHQCSLWQATQQLLEMRALSGRAASALAGFLTLIEDMSAIQWQPDLGKLVADINHHSGLMDYYGSEKGEKAESRVENLKELERAAANFKRDEDDDLLNEFLAGAALDAGEAQADEWQDSVQLMSLHSAKGLEFPLVFLTGMEEGLFPHQRCMDDPVQLEEERRLCYVGMTRAMKQLYLTYAELRRLHGRELHTRVSRFVGELPEGSAEEVRGSSLYSVGPASRVGTRSGLGGARRAAPIADDNAFGIRIGNLVEHSKFGEGVVTALEGAGESARAQVNFNDAGSKWLVLSMAKLQKR
ncbi:DNA helicase II [Gammaproteobacteria bacterium]|nr:DNA helicase II [Gammaproteobacteria bacterium]